MPDASRQRIRRTTFIYWMLLTYIIAALVWWFISLERQNSKITQLQYKIARIENIHADPGVAAKNATSIQKDQQKNNEKYIGEGLTFLALILIGAVFVYRSISRQLKLQQQQQNFMMAITHELKTPISVARLNLETLLKYDLSEEKKQKLLDIALDETLRLDFLTSNILLAAQLDNKNFNATKEELSLTDLVKETIHQFRKRFPDREFPTTINVDADMKGDAFLLQMLINNLVQNAIKYSPREIPIVTSLQQNKSGIILQIADGGDGIANSEKAKIFSKFYRIGNESTRKTKGTGLGLYLCRKIAKAHNGDISVTDNEPKGSIFIVRFKS
ncbi:MAG TPA: ATP-binding protein [Chitinophagaceae bacterium]|nr:two-component sensor histidine kinase [Chitinophagaceae bacterium]HQV05253.1 ATP-binding protein [Chitinophagaceae bacterium]